MIETVMMKVTMMIFKKIDLYMHLYIVYKEPLQRNAHLSLLREICQQSDVGIQIYETQHTYHVTLSQIRVYQAHAS